MIRDLSARLAASDLGPGLSRLTLTAAAVLVGALVAGVSGPALAQKASLETIRQRDQELDAVRTEQKQAAEAEGRLKAEIAAIGEDRRKLNQALIDAAARLRAVEARIAQSEARLSEFAQTEDRIRASLEGRRAVIAQVLAALQRIGRRPPPALLVRPEHALESVRTAMMLGAVLPDMRQEVDQLASDLAELVRVRAAVVTERQQLSGDLTTLAEDRNRKQALETERQKRQGEAEQALDSERQRALQLARQAGNLADLIVRLEQGLDSAARAARKADQSGDGKGDGKSEGRGNLAALKDPGRLTPAVAFGGAKGLLPLPVNGVKLRDFGATDGSGSSEKGVSIATRAGAQVTAPCDGWVVYAAPYRSYGQLLILNGGGGYHVLLAGMERISVDLGQFVLTGEPVAVMGNGPQVATAAMTGLSGTSQPVLYIEFRKDGSPVDPTPWWVTPESEKVRG
jgi:murein hydrolase activator